MRKQNKAKGLDELPIKNPVAKFAHQFNKAQIFADKRKYKRKAKHTGLEPFSIASCVAIEKGSRPLPENRTHRMQQQQERFVMPALPNHLHSNSRTFAVKTAHQGFQTL